jgi:dihydrofolate reductase
MEAIYAVDAKNGLSKDGVIPWNSKRDLNFFMKQTLHNVVIMGRKTYFSLPKRPLKNRLNIVLTHEFVVDTQEKNVLFTSNDTIYKFILENREYYLSMYPALNPDFKIFFIGGKIIYEKYIPLCETVWVTRIKKDYSCDLFFEYDYSKQFKDEAIIEEDDELKIVKYMSKQ